MTAAIRKIVPESLPPQAKRAQTKPPSEILKEVQEMEAEILAEGGGAIIYTPGRGFRLVVQNPNRDGSLGALNWISCVAGMVYSAQTLPGFNELMVQEAERVASLLEIKGADVA